MLYTRDLMRERRACDFKMAWPPSKMSIAEAEVLVSWRPIMAYLPLILRGNRAMPLFRAAAPFKGDILKEIEWIVSINSDRIAMPGCVESLPPAIVEFHEAGILDAVRLGSERVR